MALSIIAIALAAFSLGFNLGKLAGSRQEQAKYRNDQGKDSDT